MRYDPDKHHRRSMRLRGYDYSQAGAYFVTICTQHRECLFGAIVGNEMMLSDAGRMIQDVWEQLPQRFPTIESDAYAVMPNHFHAIIIVGASLVDAQSKAFRVSVLNRAGTRPAPTARNLALGSVIGAFKSITTNEYIHGVREENWLPFDRRLWQRNYYEHIIRNATAAERIRDYIETNPLRWALDRENPNRRGIDHFDHWLHTYHTK